MKLWFAFISCTLLTVPTLAQKQPTQAPFTLTVSGESPTSLASGVWVKVRWTNTSQQPVDASANILDATNVDPNLHFELRDENGHLLPRKVYNFPQTSGHAEFGILKAGESIAYDVNLLRLFDIKQSGKFALQVLRQIPQALGTGTVKSNTISITISE